MSATASTDIVKVDDGQTTEIAIDAPSSPDPNMKLALPPSGFTEDEAKVLEINGPHVITFGWGDHGRTGITKETYEMTQLSPRPIFLTIQEQIKIAEEEAKLKRKGKKKVPIQACLFSKSVYSLSLFFNFFFFFFFKKI